MDRTDLKQREPRLEARLASIRKTKLKSYFFPAAFLRAAQRAFIASESFRRPAAVRPRFFFGAAFVAADTPPAFRRAAQRAFIDSESFLRPAAVNPRRRLDFLAAGAAAVVVPLRFAQRARAAAASFARVAADIRRRPPPERRPPPRRPPPVEVDEPPNKVDNRCSSALICFLIEIACVSC